MGRGLLRSSDLFSAKEQRSQLSTHPTHKATMKSLLLPLVSLPTIVTAEHRRFDGPLSAASNYIHYSEGYVVTPGYVDISELEFEAVSGSNNRLFNAESGGGMVEAEGYDDEYVDDDEGRRRRLEDDSGSLNTVSLID